MTLKALNEEQRALLEELLAGKVEDVEDGIEKASEIMKQVLGSKAEVVVKADEELATHLKEAFEAVGEQFKALNARLDAIAQRQDVIDVAVKAIQTTEDDKISEALSGTDWAAAFRSAIEKGVEHVEEDDTQKIAELKEKAVAGVVTKTDDVTSDNPLAFAFRQMLAQD